MEKIIKEFYIYEFDELKEDVKQKLIEKERKYQLESYCDCWLKDDMNHKAKELVYEYFDINNVDVSPLYDLSYCQGSGAMILFNISIVDLNNKYKTFSDEEIKFLTEKNVASNIYIKHSGGMYYHEYTFRIDDDYYNGWDYDDIKDSYGITEKDFETIEDRFYELIDICNKNGSQFIKDIINMNKELTQYGYEFMEYFGNCTDAEIIGYIKDRNEKYLESGETYYGI